MSDRTEQGQALRVFWAEDATLDSLRRVLGDNRLRWCYGERMEDVHLSALAGLLDEERSVPLERFEAGRSFSADLEVDWWREDGSYCLRALLSEGGPPQGVVWEEVAQPVLTSQGEDEHQLVLWGTYDEELGAWAEARIPRPLHHPMPPEARTPERVVLRVRDYRRDGAVVLTRFLNVEPYAT
jgi:hypothetical protein